MILNDLQKVMLTKIERPNYSKGNIVPVETAKTSANWLRKHKQTNNGKSYEKIQDK